MSALQVGHMNLYQYGIGIQGMQQTLSIKSMGRDTLSYRMTM